jgi:two-component system, OmpR family, sensor histidine kinase MtrB
MAPLHDPGRGRRRVTLPVRRLGLRARIIASFALGGLLLSATLAAVTYGLVRENLVRQRETSAVNQVLLNAGIVRDQLRSADADELLASLPTPAGSRLVLFHEGQWTANEPLLGRAALPDSLREGVLAGSPGRMRYVANGDAELAVGVPLPAVNAAYFEIISFQQTAATLDALGVSLFAAALLTTLGGAATGAWASRRVLRPLAEFSDAAASIAGGNLDTRLEGIDDADLTDLVRSFNDMANSLQERIERDARFASDVSHELRSPLTTLAASISILEGRRDELPERSRAALDLLVADVQRFQTMVEDLLEISRVDAGATSLDLDPVNLGELVLHAVSTHHDADVPVDLAADTVDITVMADKRRLVRVIANLIDNARKHGGGATLVSVARHDGRVRVAVEDQGPGVDPEYRERIFERFSRGSGAGRRTGSDGVGLGLSLVREHMHLHDGQIWVEDRADGEPGARFVFEMPVVEDA